MHRVLVLEGGPFVLPDHVQNLPLPGLGVPPPTSIAELRRWGQDGLPRAEVWGLPWHSDTPSPGLAYCLGGRSLYFGGWAPQPLDEELPKDLDVPAGWPACTVEELTGQYFADSAAQIGTEETNDFIYGALQHVLRQALYDALIAGAIADAIPLEALPDHPALRKHPDASGPAAWRRGRRRR